ncbi:MAG: hypothetical protein KF857_11185 [Fimbriimonadaceae bacterium]|nr:hypothetical protein [Fimbriimonadaceae bacterium]
MAATPTEDVIDVSDTLHILLRSWKLVGSVALGLCLLVGLFTFIVPPLYEARFSVLFPRAQSTGAGTIVQLAINTSSDVQYLGGVVKSHDMRKLISEKAEVRVKDVENSMDINEMPERRQLEVAFRGYSDKKTLAAVVAVLDRLKQLDQRLLFNVSDRISSDLAKEVEANKTALDQAQARLAEFQKTAKTSPSSTEDFTGSEYLRRAESARIEHEGARRNLQAKITQAAKIGQAMDLNLPTGDSQIADWRKDLLKARYNLDAARARYQPGTQQVKDAEDNLRFTQNSIKQEVQAKVTSVQKGIDESAAALFAAELTTRWLAEDAAERAKVAPEEARRYRSLLSDIRTTNSAYESTLAAFRQEDVRNKVEKLQWSVLDEPYLLEEPVNKKYGLNMLAGLVLGGFIGSVVAVRKGRKR